MNFTALGADAGGCSTRTYPLTPGDGEKPFQLCAGDATAGLTSRYSTQFPAPISAAATWSRDLIYARASAIGKENADVGIDTSISVVAGPLGRNPWGGRSWECVFLLRLGHHRASQAIDVRVVLRTGASRPSRSSLARACASPSKAYRTRASRPCSSVYIIALAPIPGACTVASFPPAHALPALRPRMQRVDSSSWPQALHWRELCSWCHVGKTC